MLKNKTKIYPLKITNHTLLERNPGKTRVEWTSADVNTEHICTYYVHISTNLTLGM